jgi:hypothetical protein
MPPLYTEPGTGDLAENHVHVPFDLNSSSLDSDRGNHDNQNA